MKRRLKYNKGPCTQMGGRRLPGRSRSKPPTAVSDCSPSSLLLQFPARWLSLSCGATAICMEANSSLQLCDACDSLQRPQQLFHPSLGAPTVCRCRWEGWQLRDFATHHLGVPSSARDSMGRIRPGLSSLSTCAITGCSAPGTYYTRKATLKRLHQPELH